MEREREREMRWGLWKMTKRWHWNHNTFELNNNKKIRKGCHLKIWELGLSTTTTSYFVVSKNWVSYWYYYWSCNNHVLNPWSPCCSNNNTIINGDPPQTRKKGTIKCYISTCYVSNNPEKGTIIRFAPKVCCLHTSYTCTHPQLGKRTQSSP